MLGLGGRFVIVLGWFGGRFWTVLGSVWGHLGMPVHHLRTNFRKALHFVLHSLKRFGPVWVRFGTVFVNFGTVWVRFGSVCGRFGFV